MQIRAKDDIEIFQDIIPSIPPLAFSLHSSFLSSHCSSCSCPLPSALAPTSSSTPSCFLNYCSNPKCAATDTPIYHTSGEHHLFLFLQSNTEFWPDGLDTSDLRLALRLLLLLPAVVRSSPYHLLMRYSPSRFLGLSTGNHWTYPVPDHGPFLIAMARAMRDGTEHEIDYDDDSDFVLEQSVLSLVMTNAVEVNLNGEMAVGAAVYDWRFSWINHSCSPNSFFRFIHAFDAKVEMEAEAEEDLNSMRTEPFGDFGPHHEILKSPVCTVSELPNRRMSYGPRVIVRNIKALQRGEEVTITYLDLLQPRGLRQGQLKEKYQFTCSCRRCSAKTYVDAALEETLHTNLSNCYLCSHNKKYEAIESFTEMFHSTIDEYMEVGDPVKCCNDIEGLLTECKYENHTMNRIQNCILLFRFSPLHHLSLNGYTTLISTYKILADLRSTEDKVSSFELSKTSVAYSLLLAGASHSLFMTDCSLVASTATFMLDAGESLLGLARSPFWSSIENCTIQNLSTFGDFNCLRCSLTHMFESSYSQLKDFDDISGEFLRCLLGITSKVWRFLVDGHKFLKDVKDPVDFSWLEGMRSSYTGRSDQLNHHELSLCHGNYNGENHSDEEESGTEMRSSVLRLGVHCLLYGGYLSSTCYGCFHPKTSLIRNMLYI